MYSSQLDRYDIAMHSSRVEYYMSIVSNKHNHNVSGKKTLSVERHANNNSFLSHCVSIALMQEYIWEKFLGIQFVDITC